MSINNMLMAVRRTLLLLPALCLSAVPVSAADQSFTFVLSDHRFMPASLEVSAGVRFILVVKNADSEKEEFESYSLNREVVIGPGEEARINLGPLKPGNYAFVGEFHAETAQGQLIAR
jgi:hypothetical protein